MTRIGRALAPLALAAALGLSAAASHAGEGFVIKVRGMGLTIDKGADDGMVVGMSVTVMRSPDEPVIHPITGENLGSPEIEIADGEITKVSARASSIRLPRPALLPVRPGDIVRYTTVDEQTTETAEGATQERRVIRGGASRPAGNIKGVERSIKRLDRFDKDVVPRQFTRINKDIVAIKDELRELRETVTLLGSVPDIGAVTGEMPSELSEADAERLTDLIQEVHARLAAQQQEVEGELPEAGPPLPDEARTGYEEIDDAGRDSFLSSLSPWIFIIVGVVGLAAVGLWLFMRMSDDEGRRG
ncbi:MAG: hypothetical protein VX911_11075 [Candidatus Latescibacterota bacterium]|nr:hypothetical protein [Candidatus Latescibacterota bacterium]